MSLTDLNLRRTYDPDVCPDPVADFYSPALSESVAYDRNTFTFTANGLVAAAAGLAGLLRNDGRVRIICEPKGLSAEVHQAIIAGHTQALLDAAPPEDLTNITEGDIRGKNQLDMITWLVAQGRLEIRVALPKTAEQSIFHDKTGIITDSDGNRVSFDGIPNETEAGWGRNYERFHLFRSWSEPERVKDDVEHFERLWSNQSAAVHVIPVPEAYSEHLKTAAPGNNSYYARYLPLPRGTKNGPTTYEDRRGTYWRRIQDAIRNDPATTLATTPVTLWPHQAAFSNRHAGGPGPDRLLIADEVGLGKTIQAGILLQDAGRLAGRPHRPVEHLMVAGVVALIAAAHDPQHCRHGTWARGKYRADQQHLGFPPSLPSATTGGRGAKQRCEGNENGYNGIGQGEHGWAFRKKWGQAILPCLYTFSKFCVKSS